ncbi:MAG: GNAT family N-acetyltransferase [Acidobacteriota bacterium]|nr:GNAT family N-acetyltransferase [Acidobacteriota bacterium]
MLPLQTDRLMITVFDAEDWRDFLELSRNPDVMQHISEGKPWSEEKTRRWIAAQSRKQAEQGYSRYKLVLEETGELAGFCGLGLFGNTGEVEIGWWIKQSLWGKGLATEAAQAVKDYALGTLGLDHLISVCTPANKASYRIMEKIGLTFREETTAEALGLQLPGITLLVYTSNIEIL